MKKYFKYFLVSFFLINILMIFLALLVYRNSQIRLPFLRLEIGGLIISAIIGLTVFMFRLEKGNSLVNVIIGYVIMIPGLLVLRNVFGTYLFRSASLIYIIMVVVGIIYGVVVYIVSRRYKSEVELLNRLLEEKSQKEED